VSRTGLTATFTSTSTGSPASYLWNFGDGTTSTAPSPAHTYATGGDYTVTLTVANLAGSNQSTQTVVLAVANFGYVATGANSVTFTDTSSPAGSVQSRVWDFGGLGTSTAANPTFTFPAPGSYTVRLTINGGASSIARTVTVL
jgi:PKD repeat protein